MRVADWIELGRMDELGRGDSPVHRLDARMKTLATAVFIVVVMSFPRYEVAALMPFFLFPFALMTVGSIPPGFILKKLLVAAPFALAVGIFNPILDRHTVAIIGSHGISGGWLSLASITIRFMLTVSAALTLVACTGIHRLCAGLEQMGIPRVFAVQLQMLYRYLFVITGEGLRMARGVEMRSAGRSTMRLRTYAPMVGHLLLRSIDRAQRVYEAMVSRGYEGHGRVMRPTSVRGRDIAFLAVWIVYFSAARFWNIARWLGSLVTGGGA